MQGLLTDIFESLKSWGFKRVFVQNAHGDPTHIEMIKSAIAQANEAPDFKVYFMWELDIEITHDITFPQMREDRYEPDYHAGAIETAQMAAFFPEKVRGGVAKALKPQNNFHPLAYCGDPASYDLEFNMAEFTKADVKLDALKIEAILLRDGK
jgi:creatinine amidohydrolase